MKTASPTPLNYRQLQNVCSINRLTIYVLFDRSELYRLSCPGDRGMILITSTPEEFEKNSQVEQSNEVLDTAKTICW